ncbi:PspA [Corallococcus exiguus]|uniref:PspA n=1 Tax=Corallococcus exiguus TaxID=83462 RepID=UPI0014720CA1|nr:PspA [Corallococcus exiguus]NNB90013.1 PspA [Corallococcus exiguus]
MQNDMRSTIQAAVAEEVGKAMGRQLELLVKIAQFLGIEPGPTPAASAPKRAPVSPPAPKRTPSVPVRKWVKPQAASKPARTEPAPQKSRGRARAAGRTATATTPSPEASTSYAAGQEVRYKQGRGTFSAKVKSVDEKAKTVTVARVSDGKEVVRPFDKVTPV